MFYRIIRDCLIVADLVINVKLLSVYTEKNPKLKVFSVEHMHNTTLISILKTCLKQKLLHLQVKNLTKISLLTYT